MLQRLPMALAQVKSINTPENLLNEIRQIIYSLYQEKKNYKKVYNNIMSSIQLQNRIWILKIVKHLILTDYYSIFQIK